MVLDHHLRHGHRMTLITFQDGMAVMRDGKVGTEQECCCAKCLCDGCPESLGFSVTFYGTKSGTLTFTHPYTAPSGVQSAVTCDRYFSSTNIAIGLTEDEAIPFGFSNIATVSVAIACGAENAVEDGKWYVLINGTVAINANNDQVPYQFEGLVSVCDQTGLAVIDTDLIDVQQCTDPVTGNPIVPCPIRVVVVLST